MFKKISFFLLALTWLGLSIPGVVLANHIPPPSGYVNDFANVLTPSEKNSLELSLKSYTSKTTNEITIATVKSLNGGDIVNFSVKTFEEWKIGKKGKDNGLLILSAIDDHKVRIEIGYGLEPSINDARAGQIIRNDITPNFKNGKYYDGFSSAVSDIESSIGGSYVDKTPTTNQSPVHFPIIWFVLIPIVIYLMAYFARSKRFWGGGVVGAGTGALFGWLNFGNILIIGGLGLGFGLLGLLLDWYISRNYERIAQGGDSLGWLLAGSLFNNGQGENNGGNDGFGGFGGGSSGGGGASGDW